MADWAELKIKELEEIIQAILQQQNKIVGITEGVATKLTELFHKKSEKEFSETAAYLDLQKEVSCQKKDIRDLEVNFGKQETRIDRLERRFGFLVGEFGQPGDIEKLEAME